MTSGNKGEIFHFNGHEIEMRFNMKHNRVEFLTKGQMLLSIQIKRKSLTQFSSSEREELKEEFKTQFRAEALQTITPERLREQLSECCDSAGESLLRNAWRWEQVNSQEGIFLSNAARQTHQNLTRLRDSIDQSLPVVAWPARNIYELFLWVFYVTKVEGGMLDDEKGILSLHLLDKKELAEGFYNVLDNPSPRIQAKHKERLQDVQDEADKLKIKVAKRRKSTSDLVFLVDHTLDDKTKRERRIHDAFYKLTSKFLHPSPYTLLHTPREEVILTFRQVMANHAIDYARRTLTLIRDQFYLRRDESKERECE